VTQKNKGKNTPGIDGRLYSTPERRWKLLNKSFNFQTFQPYPVKQISIHRTNGRKRRLGILTMKDRVMQTVVKTALEPEGKQDLSLTPTDFGRDDVQWMQSTKFGIL
jgi:RNA-directed DNA polymerase